MSPPVPTEDLLVLARQCKLGEDEERRLEIAMQSSRELECLYDAGLHFDDEAGLLSGDETRSARLVERTLERLDRARDGSALRAASMAPSITTRPSRTSARYFGVSAALGMLLFVTLASAWDYVQRRVAQPARPTSASASASAGHELPRPAARLARAPSPEPVAGDSALAAPSAGPPRTVSPSAEPGRKPALVDELSPSELFARANQARRRGDIEEAITLYERLDRAYPGSMEAEDAKILRGNLLLSQRSPRAALRQFEDYHAGALSLEALWGRAQALRKLESPDERAILVQLIRDYPDSLYAEAARKRLRELAR